MWKTLMKASVNDNVAEAGDFEKTQLKILLI